MKQIDQRMQVGGSLKFKVLSRNKWIRRCLSTGVGTVTFGGLWATGAQAQIVATTGSTSTKATVNDNPGLHLSGSGAEGFVFAIVGVFVLALFFPVVFNALSATRVQRRQQRFVRRLVSPPKGRTALSAQDVSTILVAYGRLPQDPQSSSDQGSGGQSLTTSLLALATLALVGLALVLLFVSSSSDAADLRKTIITALVSILASISGFYFGARTAQVSAQQASSGSDPDSSPKFTTSSPPTTGAVGDTYSYHFTATGSPQPKYEILDGPPDWLKIDSTSGFVSGTVPVGHGSFKYSVIAHNRAGSDKAGPFDVAV
jgi:hypothetical protein